MASGTLLDIRRLVRAERRSRGLTQGETAEMVGHTQKWVSDFESGRGDPPVSMVLKLLDVLGQEVVITSRIKPSPDTETENEIDIEGDL